MSRSELVVRLPLIAPQEEQEPEPPAGNGFPIQARILGPFQSGFGAPRHYYGYVVGSWATGTVSWAYTGPATQVFSGDFIAVVSTGAGTLEVTATIDGVEYSATRAIIL